GYDVRKQRYGCPQTPQSDADLVQCFRIAGLYSGLIDHDLRKARPCDDPERLGNARARIKLNFSCLYRNGGSAIPELVPSFRLALESEATRNRAAQLACNAEQFGRLAAFELELEFSDRCRSSTRVDRTIINGELDLGCFGRNRIDRAADLRLEKRF